MPDLMTSAQMRAVEAAAIASGRVSGLELMERAPQGAVAAILAEWPELDAPANGGAAPAPPRYLGQDETEAPQVIMLCGPGNNGGDGFAMARLLHEKGWQVRVLFPGKGETLPPDAQLMWRRWQEAGTSLGWTVENARHLAGSLTPDRPLLVVDALFGIGLSRPLGAEVTEVWDAFCDQASNLSAIGALFLCAVDVPSGVSDAAPEGERLAGFDDPRAHRLTVTFHAPKRAHRAMIAAGERLVVVDIGLGTPLEAQA